MMLSACAGTCANQISLGKEEDDEDFQGIAFKGGGGAKRTVQARL